MVPAEPPDAASSVPSNNSGVWMSSVGSMSPSLQENIYQGQPSLFPPILVNTPWENTPISPKTNAAPGLSAPKVAIPRLSAPTATRGRRRSARACEACRTRKTKCDGVRPTCGQCTYHGNRCTYEDVKRVRDQKMLDVLARRVDRYETLLRSLEEESDPATTRRIRKTLKNDGKSSQNSEDSDSDSSVGSLDAVDVVEEDINRDESTRAAGYFGKNSEIVWMQSLEDGVERDGRQQSTASQSESANETLFRPQDTMDRDIPIVMMNYHLDDLDIPIAEDVDPFAVPPRELADEYLNTYMTYVHPLFNAVRKPAFISQYRQFFDLSAKPPRKWLGVLNMIFAIGCRYSRLVGSTNIPHEDDLVFLSRTWKLSMQSNKILLKHTDLQQIQLEFLVAVYLLCLAQVNRASKFSGMALRSAISLGINLRLTDNRTHNASKEARCRLWWSIYSLENLLTSMHGRASGVGENLCSVPAPVPIDEEHFGQPEVQRIFLDRRTRESQLRPTIFENPNLPPTSSTWISNCNPSPSLLFYYLVDLALISQEVLNKVYSIEGIREGTSQTEYRLQKYATLLDRWLAKLPQPYQFTIPSSTPWHLNHAKLDNTSSAYIHECICLAMSYFSARITLCRPCLSHTPSSLNDARSQIRSEMATQCLQAACTMISLLPDTPDIPWLASVTPWWSILHFLMQATTALLLGLASSHTPVESYSALNEGDLEAAIGVTRKAFLWIHTMATVDASARRAFVLIEGVMMKIAPGLSVDLKEWPSSELKPSVGNGVRLAGLDELIDFEMGTFV